MAVTKSDILSDLIEDTLDDIIPWEFIMEDTHILAKYEKRITKNKKLIFKLLYFSYNPLESKFEVVYNIKKDNLTIYEPIFKDSSIDKIEIDDFLELFRAVYISFKKKEAAD